MKQIQKRGKPGNWKYTGTVRLNGHSVSLTFPLKSQAQEWCDRVEISIKDEMARGIPFDKSNFLPKKPERQKSLKEIQEEQKLLDATYSEEWTLNRAIEEYKNTELDKLKGFKQALNRLKKWQKHPFASLKLNEITPELLAEYVKEKEQEGLSGSTIRNNVYRISAIYELAIKPKTQGGWNLKLENPVTKILLPKIGGHRQIRLHKYDEDVLFLALSEGMYADEMVPFCTLSLESGMRKSEILGITKKEIQITKRGWQINKHDTKNGERRTVYLSSRATDAIKPLYARLKNDTDTLFSISTNAITNHFIRARDRAGVPHIRLHDLRHEAVSRLADKGLSVGAISNQSGHRSMQTLLRYVNAKEADIRAKMEQDIL